MLELLETIGNSDWALIHPEYVIFGWTPSIHGIRTSRFYPNVRLKLWGPNSSMHNYQIKTTYTKYGRRTFRVFIVALLS